MPTAIHEKVSSPKVSDNIYKDAKEAGKKTGKELIEKFKNMGFRPEDVMPHIKRGIKESSDDL